MMNFRCSSIPAVVAGLVCTIGAQSPAAKPTPVETPFGKAFEVLRPETAAANSRWTLWVSYPNASGALLDQSLYLGDLQRRFGGQGLQVAVVLPASAARLVADKKPGFVVAGTPEGLLDGLFQRRGMSPTASSDTSPCVLCDGATPVRSLPSVDFALDMLTPCLAGNVDKMPAQELIDVLLGMLSNVGDAYADHAQVTVLLQALPHSGLVRGLAVLEQWWCVGDYEAADKAIDDGFQALAGESVPMCLFADLVLRGDRTDARLAKRVAAELGPVAASAPDGALTQLVYLRALLRAGQDRLADRVVSRLPERIAKSPQDQLLFAETLMEATKPPAFREPAMSAIQQAQRLGVDPRLCTAAQHKVLVRCGDLDAAAKLMTEYRGSDANSSSLNNDAWYLMTRIDTMGRFDTFAMAQCEEMQRLDGDNLINGNKDTVALSLFLNGKLQEAVDLQTVAAAGSQQSPPYLVRLTRFQAALAKSQQAKPAHK